MAMELITVEALKKRIDNGEEVILIDVREPQEHQDFNIGGQLIPLGSIPAALADLTPLKDKEIVMYCRSGNRSGHAQAYLEQFGFSKVFNLEGGMLDWEEKFGR